MDRVTKMTGCFFTSGYRSASDDTVRLNCWVGKISSTIMVVKQTRLLCKWFLRQLCHGTFYFG